MKTKKSVYKWAKKINKRVWFFAVVAMLFLLNLGYASLLSTVEVVGTVSASTYGRLFIEEVTKTDFNGVVENALPVYNDDLVLSTNVGFPSNEYASITYKVVIANGSDEIQKYTGLDYLSDIDTTNVINYTLEGINEGDYIFPGQSREVTLTYLYRSDAASGDYILSVQFLFEDSGKFFATLNNNTVSLVGNPLGPISLKVMNNNENAINYSLAIESDKFDLVDADGNLLGEMSAGRKANDDITIYLKAKDGAVFYKSKYNASLSLVYNENTINFGNLDITVSPTLGYEDDLAPQIGPVSIDITDEVGAFDITWTRTDDEGAPVTDYGIFLYDTDGNLVAQANTGSDYTTYRFTNQAPGNYYAIVYGVDEAENSGLDDVISATTETTNARRSNDTEIRWIRTVSFSGNNYSNNGAATVNYGQSYTVTLTPATYYTVSGVTVTMNGNTLTQGTDYTFNNNIITIPRVTGDIAIDVATTGCLVKGTKILLADGKYKNIEDVNYDDLLVVYNHEIGEFSYEYPIWIEKEHESDVYQITSFSDGTKLKTVMEHAVFSVDENRYVDISDKKHVKVGTTILKVIKKNGKYKLSKVKVTNIKHKKERVKYYHVVTTRYYNLVANNILTSDGRPDLSNYYEFDKDYTWTDRREEVIDNNIQLDYSVMDFAPYYLFKGLKAQDGAVLIKYGYMTKEDFVTLFNSLLLNENMIKQPMVNDDSNRVWMVTNSLDKVTNKNKSDYLYVEGSYYTLPDNNKKGFINWYNTMDGNYYNPGDVIRVDCGMHFVENISKK